MARRELRGARILVTGASSGIGRALARELARRRAETLLVARRGGRLKALCDELASRGAVAAALVADVADPEDRARIAEDVARRWGALDALVNNAGIGAIGPFIDADPGRLRRLMEVNFFAPFELARSLYPYLARGRRPILVNVGSVLGHRAVPGKSEYCASKFAMHGMSDAIRAEFARSGIDVLLASPSTTATEFFDGLGERHAAAARRRGARPEAIARRIVAAMRAGRHEIIPSWGGRALVWFDRLFPACADRLLARWPR
ncbi:MAG: SDR family NAD(P)-dependent oxidoreductase [Planctomycetes bacterium]|nr:SDR family NAD(P)-dependent oxidoreductase [Planctomycetota bacterium]